MSKNNVESCFMLLLSHSENIKQARRIILKEKCSLLNPSESIKNKKHFNICLEKLSPLFSVHGTLSYTIWLLAEYYLPLIECVQY